MSDSINLDDIESFINNIESEIFQLLKLLTSDSIPNRTMMVNRDYFKRLQEYDFVKSSRDAEGEPRLIKEEEPRNTVQFIKSLLIHIPEDHQERKKYLEKVLSHFGSITQNDKQVLISSLLTESPDKIKAAIQEILDAFS